MNKKIIRTALALLFVSLLITAPRAQQIAPVAAKQSPEDRIALYQALLDLTNPWTVMCIAAHPDDEDGTSLIVMRRKYGAHTVSLFSTFGEGGQNAIGPELYEEMGAIRARETMAAAEIQGSEPHFLGLKDFGYSKSADEAFKFWGHDEALRRMVLEIRKLRPDVIITNHSATSNDHGHHQATARLELEAFDAAADPKRFPEQLKDGVTVWQVQRLFVRARGNQAQTSATSIVTIDPNEKDPVRGVVYAEEALRGLQQHATQGPWPKTFAEYASRFRAFSGQNAPTGQLPMIRYALVRSANGAPAMPAQESHTFLDGLKLQTSSTKFFDEAQSLGDGSGVSLNNRAVLFTRLAELQKHVDRESEYASSDSQRIRRLYIGIGNTLGLLAGIKAHVVAQSNVVRPGRSVGLSVIVTNDGREVATISYQTILDPNQVAPIKREWSIPPDAHPNIPLPLHLYDSNVFGEQISEEVTVRVRGVRFTIMPTTRVNIGKPVDIMGITPSVIVADRKREKSASVIPLSVQVSNGGNDSFTGELTIVINPASQIPSMKVNVASRTDASVTTAVDTGRLLASAQHASNRSLTVRLTQDSKFVTERSIPVVFVNAEVTPNLRVGYVRGFDFSLPNALAALGVESKELSVDEVKTADLQKYTSIIVDNRVYESQPELIAANQRLLDYANAGGTLIVFYHKSDEWNPDERRKRPQLAPYKLILGNERITDENAPITFLEPENPLLNIPNKLGPDDFKDWIQERGLYYPKEWDPQFHAVLQSNDPNEAPLKGGLLVADYGRGHYIYSSMVWYRQLRAGVPGAYRMLANMISYGRR